MGDLNLVQANLVAFWVQCVLYGVFLVVFAASLYVLLFKKERNHMNTAMTVASIMQLLLISASVIFNLIRALIAFGQTEMNPFDYYDRMAQGLEGARILFLSSLSLVSDSVVAYRCWIFYDRKLAVLLVPATLLVATLVTAIFTYTNMMELKPGAVFSEKLAIWIVSFFFLTMFTNGLCSILIASRILKYLKRMRDARGISTCMRVVSVMIGCSVVYTVVLIITIATYLSKSNVVYPAGESLVPLIGIVFNLMIAVLNFSTDDRVPRTRSSSESFPSRRFLVTRSSKSTFG